MYSQPQRTQLARRDKMAKYPGETTSVAMAIAARHLVEASSHSSPRSFARGQVCGRTYMKSAAKSTSTIDFQIQSSDLETA